jgi:hypothetical protein
MEVIAKALKEAFLINLFWLKVDTLSSMKSTQLIVFSLIIAYIWH